MPGVPGVPGGPGCARLQNDLAQTDAEWSPHASQPDGQELSSVALAAAKVPLPYLPRASP